MKNPDTKELRTIYQVDFVSKTAQKFDYKEGLYGDILEGGDIHISDFKSENIHDLLKKIENHYGFSVSPEFYEDRVCYSVLENGEGEEATQNEIELWKKEEEILYCAYYYFYVSKSFEVLSFDIEKEIEIA